MHTNILPFPKARRTKRAPALREDRDNVIQLSEWRDKARIRRTHHGVFFETHVLGFTGNAA